MVTLEDVRAKRRELQESEANFRQLSTKRDEMEQEYETLKLTTQKAYHHSNDLRAELKHLAFDFAIDDGKEDAIPTVIPGMEDDIPF